MHPSTCNVVDQNEVLQQNKGHFKSEFKFPNTLFALIYILMIT